MKFWLRSFLYTKRTSVRFASEYSKTRALKGTKIGYTALILGGGPSVSKLDPKRLSHYLSERKIDVFACNNYLLSDFSKYVSPDYYVLSDPDFFFPEETKKGHGFAFDVTRSLYLLYRLGVTVFIPITFFGTHSIENKVYYFNDCRNFCRNYSSNILAPRNFSSKTGLKSIRIADYMGYDYLYVIGIDSTAFLDFRKDENNMLVDRHNHFYNSDKTSQIVTRKDVKTSDLLYRCANQFSEIEAIGRNNAGRIFNLDKDSYVDAFEKLTYFDIYKEPVED